MKEQLYIIQFIFSTKIKLYNLMVYGENDYVITKKKKLLFFYKFQHTYEFWDKNKLKKNYTLQKKIALTCNVPLALKIIKKNRVDNSSVVLNCINTFDDLFKTINLEFPLRYRKSLYKLADHLTFKKEITSFLNDSGYSREFIIKGLLKIEEIINKNMILFNDLSETSM